MNLGLSTFGGETSGAGLSDMLQSEFAGYTPLERPVINNVIINPH